MPRPIKNDGIDLLVIQQSKNKETNEGNDYTMGKYNNMKQEEFDQILLSILREQTAEQLISIPGIYEILAEEFNNEVLDRWENEQEEEE
jgi:hypothetical protein